MTWFRRTWIAGLTVLLLWTGAANAQSSGPTASPTTLSFSYQVNSTTYPAAAKLTATLPAASVALPMSVTVAATPQGWLTVTPDTGRSPLALTVSVNPTSLTPGSYGGTITINTIPGGSNPAVVPVTLLISNPPSTLVVTSPSSNYSAPATGSSLPTLTFIYTTGTVSTLPVSSELDVASTGDIIPFNVTASNSGGSKTSVWLRVNQTGQLANLQTSGVALSGSYVPINVSLDIATLTTLDPGSYGGLITVAANSASNGTAVVAVNLVISAGPPTLSTSLPVFPSSVIAGPAIDPVITIYGDNFFSTSVVAIQSGTNPSVTLPSKLLSRKVLQATIKAAYLAVPTGPTVYPIQWILSVTNPAPPNNPSQAPATTTFAVTDPTQPAITSVVNSASFAPTAVYTGTTTNPVLTGATSVSPREIISIFGQNLGPITPLQATPSGTPVAYQPTLGGVVVSFEWGMPANTAFAPIIMISSNQINCIVPVEVAAVIGTASTTVNLQVTNGTANTNLFALTVVTEDPGVFTFGGLGQGQGAVLNFDSSSGSYLINSSKSAAPRGSSISVYATGLGDLTTALANGEVAGAAVRVADNTYRVDIDGQPAVVTYAGTSPGAVAGLVQINAIVPPTVRTGAAIPMTVSIGATTSARRSQPGVTLAVK